MRVVLFALASLMFLLPGAGHAVGEPVLVGTVGPDYTIKLESNGSPVTSVPAGTYDILVHDLSTAHNFHLTGAGVDKATEVLTIGDTTWEDVVLAAGSTYNYVCDPHAYFMAGSFTTTGSQPPQPPPGPPPPGPPPPGPPPPPPGSPPPPPPPPGVRPLRVTGVKFLVERRGARRALVARARITRAATARLALMRGKRAHASSRKPWRAGPNTIRAALPRALPSGRWTAELRVGALRFRRVIHIG